MMLDQTLLDDLVSRAELAELWLDVAHKRYASGDLDGCARAQTNETAARHALDLLALQAGCRDELATVGRQLLLVATP